MVLTEEGWGWIIRGGGGNYQIPAQERLTKILQSEPVIHRP